MRKSLPLFVMLVFVASKSFSQITLPPSGDNQKASVTQWIGPVSVTIYYSSPDVHGPNGQDRTGHIWGELVHYGFIDQGYGPSKAAPWRAGANENTTITFSHDVTINGKALKAGTYGLFLAVAEKGPWTWIFSRNSTSWGSYFYDPAEDALRVEAMPEEAPYTEYLTYGFDERKPNSTVAYLQWELKRISFKAEVPDIDEIYFTKMRDELRGNAGFNVLNLQAAAQFCAQRNFHLDQALTWADAAVNQREDFQSLQTKASVLYALNKTTEADALMEKAINHPTATVSVIHQYGRALLNQGKTEKAMEIFKLNRKRFPGDTFTTYVGLARGYAALGDKKNAIKNWEIAIKNIPENQKQFLSIYENELKKLKG